MAKKKTAAPKPVEEAAAEVEAVLAAPPVEEPETLGTAPVLTHTAPSMDPGAFEILTDVIEYEVEMIFSDREKRAERWKTLTYFWDLHPARNCNFGRLYLRRYLAELLVNAVGAPPYGTDKDEELGLVTTTPRVTSPDNLAKWDVERWSDLQDDLEHIRDILLRQDAVLNLKDESMAENPEMDEERAEMASFGKKYQILIQCLEVNKAIAPIRWDLEEQILKTDEGQPELDKKKVAEVVRIISEIKNERCVEVAETLFAKKPAKKNKGTETFEDISALAKILDSKPFNLSYVQNKIEVVLRRWSCDTFGSDDPMLFRLRYGIPPRSGLALLASTPALARRTPSKSTGGQRSPVPSIKKEDEDDEDIQRLRENRVALGEGHGEDPLEESRTLAAEAAGEGRKRTADNEDEDEEQDTKRVRRLAIDDELDEDDEEDEKERAALSELPRRRTRRPSRRFTGPPPDDGIFDEQGKVKARRKWAEEEKNAVKVGSQKFGVGKWAEIKKEYGDILRNRTSVQIKDCWRTMNKNNEV